MILFQNSKKMLITQNQNKKYFFINKSFLFIIGGYFIELDSKVKFLKLHPKDHIIYYSKIF